VNTVPSPTACPGRCNAGWRAAENRYYETGIDHDLQPREGQPVWCPPCTTAIRSAVAELPDLAVRLRAEVESGVSAAMTEYVSGSKNRPVHDHEAESFLLDEIAEWITSWEGSVRVQLGLNKRVHRTDPCTAVRGAVELLLPHLDWHINGRAEPEYDHLHMADWTGTQVATEFGLDALKYHRRAKALTGTQDVEPVRVAGVPCPICDHKALEHEVEAEPGRRQRVTKFLYGADGEVLNHHRPRPDKLTEQTTVPMQGATTGYIRCRKCRPAFRMTPDEYHAWTRLLAAGEQVRALATRDKLAEIFGGSVPHQYRAAS
jgi:hypothetical protein